MVLLLHQNRKKTTDSCMLSVLGLISVGCVLLRGLLGMIGETITDS